jgi:hypothetical protein
VSRWSVDPLRIALAPGEIAFLHAQNSLVLTAPERSTASLLSLLDAALADTSWQCRRVEVVLSQQFIRHVMTPPPGKALARTEERALVAAVLREIYGDEAGQWRIQVHSQPPQHGLLGAAMEESFAQQLSSVLTRHGFRDVKIIPLASIAAGRLPKKLDGWWALAEPGWLSLFGASSGFWHHVSARPTDEGWAALLPELIEREAPSAAEPTVWIQALGVDAVLPPATNHAHWEVLPHENQARGILALAGI